MSLVGLALGVPRDGDKNGIISAEAANVLSYVHAASKTSGLTTSKHENQSTSLSELI